jgi:hypothetical protein
LRSGASASGGPVPAYSPRGLREPRCRTRKKRGPDQCAPVICRAICVSEWASLALVFEAILGHQHRMGLATPVAEEAGAGPERHARIDRLAIIAIENPGEGTQPATGGRSKPAVDLLLHPVGDRSGQQIAGQRCRRLAAMDPAPEDPEMVDRELLQAGEFGLERTHLRLQWRAGNG